MQADVLVIGAGPAGSAAARSLASEGAAVVLVDQFEFPRDKVCGDLLLQDAISALDRLDIGATVRAKAREYSLLRVFAPDHDYVDLQGCFLCMPRRELDNILRLAAVQAGARFLAPLRLIRFIEDRGAITGAIFRDLQQETETVIGARQVFLATGAASAPLELAGVCSRKEPSGIAVRAYFRNERLADELNYLTVSFERSICPGYGWIFPTPGGVINIGAGYVIEGRRPIIGNVRRVFESFVASFPLAQTIVASSQPLSRVRGAPLRTALKGVQFARSGLLVIGEAASTTYPCTGEGIGKAIETGILAAGKALDFFRGRLSAHALGSAYEEAIGETLAPRYLGYEAAQKWMSHPAIGNLIVARARRGRFVKAQLEALLAETSDPRNLFSLRGALTALLG